MRFLCCADTHDSTPPTADESGITAWLHAGDVADRTDWTETASDIMSSNVRNWFATRTVPVYVVRGNHDAYDRHGAFANGRDVTGRVIRLASNVWLAGLGWRGRTWSDLPNDGELRPAIAQLERQWLRMATPRDLTVLLTHYPPLLNESRSSERDDSQAIRALVDRLKPVAVVEGHVHRRAGASQTIVHPDGSQTLVVNPGPAGGVIDVDLATRRATFTPSSHPLRPDAAGPWRPPIPPA